MNTSNQAVDNNLPEALQAKVDSLLDYYGIARHFIDCTGTEVQIPQAHRARILEAQGVDLSNQDAISSAFQYFSHDRHLELLKPCYVLDENPANTQLEIILSIPQQTLSNQHEWSLSEIQNDGQATTNNSGGVQTVAKGSFYGNDLEQQKEIQVSEDCNPNTSNNSGLNSETTTVSLRRLLLPPLAIGYYQLEVLALGLKAQSTIIVAPSRCYSPEWEQQQRRLAGVSVQLYSLRSNRNWGVGDFTDLRSLILESKSRGIAFVVLSPLHILNASDPEHCSPYSPIDRCRINPLYIDPEIEPDFIECPELQTLIASGNFSRELEKIRAPEFINYTGVTAIKYKVLGQMFSHFKTHQLQANSERANQFQDFIAKQGIALKLFIGYQARHGSGYAHAKDPLYHAYLQWLSEIQLERCQQTADAEGMAIGLVRDLAIGSQRESAEVELNPQLFSQKASIGAPPDPLAPQGQNWGLAPMKPTVLQQTGYRHFIHLLQANMSHCRALRIDHVMGLMRLWWCSENQYFPNQDDLGEDSSPVLQTTNPQNLHGEGAYVSYPADDLFAILRLESHRNECLVIGEDLGIVPPEIREQMSESGIFSNALFYFEKYDPVHYKSPEHFIPKALTMVANHDVPTLSAWWNKSDLDMRHQIGLIGSDVELQQAIHERESDLIQILHWLNNSGLLPASWNDFNIHREFDHDLIQAILKNNSRSSSQLVSVQLEDFCLAESPVNIPGTCNEYPNWRRKVPKNIETIFGDSDIEALISAFVQERTL